jgi:hypothetical protein
MGELLPSPLGRRAGDEGMYIEGEKLFNFEIK